MFIKISEQQRKGIKIHYEEPVKFSKEYLKFRDQKWEEKKKEADKNGKKIWNGELYTLDRFYQSGKEGIDIVFSKCEFKDRMLKKYLSPSEFRDKYGESSVRIHCGVGTLPITMDGKLVLGYKHSSLDFKKGVLAYPSGVLNVDEMRVESFSDARKYALKEFEEETGISVKPTELEFAGFKLFQTYFEFLFAVQLKISSKELSSISEESEFSSFEAFSIKKLLQYDGPIESDLENLRDEIKQGTLVL